ncbi:toprim domain-containing protein [Mycoplasma buteonis]|uniref:toprim domain-containing protein n=1 Tax=Mycoplasma buteonis TaxID=171280 RepID=UPI00056097B9|nr:toprim domain-containing protein [Mycoplasma buteonis]
MFNSKIIQEFIDRFKKVPGISKKQAEKMVLWILNNPEHDVFLLANDIKKIKEKITFCEICGNAKELDSNCEICENNQRDNVLLIVENVGIIEKIERAKFYYGKYFVFKNLIKNEKDIIKIKDQIDTLVEYAEKFDEVILAISPTYEGEITKQILKKYLISKNISVSQLAIGLPLGSSVDYIDEITLKMSMINRSK